MAYGLPQLRQRSVFDQYGAPQYGDQGQDPFFDPPAPPPPESYNPYDPNQAPGTPGRGVESPILQSPPPPANTGPRDDVSIQDWFDAINKGYTPAYESRDRFNQQIDAYPERQEPGRGRKLVAGLMGFSETGKGGGDPIKTMESVMYAPHMRDVADWKEKIDPMYKAAQTEQLANTQERQLIGSAVQGYMGDQRIRSNERIQEERNEIARIRADAEKLKAEGWTFKVLGDRVVGYDPKRPGVEIPMGSSGGMNERDKIILEGQYGIRRAEASGEAAIRRMQAGGGTVYVDPETGEGTVVNPNVVPPTRVPVPGGPLVKPGTQKAPGSNKPNALEARRIENSKLEERWKLDPEARRKYIQKEGDTYSYKKRPVYSPDGWIFSGTPQSDVDDYDAFRMEMDPDYKPPKPIGGSNKAPGTAPGERPIDVANKAREAAGKKPIGGSNKAPSAGGTVRMRTPDGRIVRVPSNKVKEAQAKGGKVVQ